VPRAIDALATRRSDEGTRGLRIQRAALRRAGPGGDLLPIYGSSELVRGSELHGVTVFRARPTGFALAPVAERGMPPLAVATMMAALAPDLRGRLVAISLSPGHFMRPGGHESDSVEAAAFRGTFPRLAANAAIFAGTTAPPLRDALARALTRFPETLDDDPLLAAGARALADGRPAARATYALLVPIGRMRLWLLERADDARALRLAWRRRALAMPPRGAPPDWDAMAREAERVYRPRASANPYGFEDRWWTEYGDYLRTQMGTVPDDSTAAFLARSPVFGELALALAVLRAAGARPLVLSMPLSGPWVRALGGTARTPALYRARLQAAARAGCERAAGPCAAVRDFTGHDDEFGFLTDVGGHLAPGGWVAYDRALADFHRAAR
jgi:D-alanine transfer protein